MHNIGILEYMIEFLKAQEAKSCTDMDGGGDPTPYGCTMGGGRKVDGRLTIYGITEKGAGKQSSILKQIEIYDAVCFQTRRRREQCVNTRKRISHGGDFLAKFWGPARKKIYRRTEVPTRILQLDMITESEI